MWSVCIMFVKMKKKNCIPGSGSSFLNKKKVIQNFILGNVQI